MRELFYAGAILTFGAIPAAFLAAARMFHFGRADELRTWVMLALVVAWSLAGGLGLLRLKKWAALLVSIPVAAVGVMMLTETPAVAIFAFAPLAVTAWGWKTLR